MVQIWGIDGERLAKVTTYEETLMWSSIPEQARPYVELDRVYQPIIESLDRDQRIEILRVSPWENTDAMSDSQVSDLAGAITNPEWIEHIRYVLINSPEILRRSLSTDQIKLMQTALAAEEDMPPLQDQVLLTQYPSWAASKSVHRLARKNTRVTQTQWYEYRLRSMPRAERLPQLPQKARQHHLPRPAIAWCD